MSDDFIQELNQDHAVVMLGGKCLILNEIVEPIFNRPDVTFSSVPDFKHRYANCFKIERNAKGSEKKIPIAEIWLRSPNRREFEGVVFSPGGDIAGFYNLWRGFAVEAREGNWDLMQEHILQIVCNRNDTNFEYFLDWMSQIVQNPGGDRPGVSIVFLGGLGFGKGIVANNFGAIFGPHFKHITHPSRLTGKFNSVLKDALLVFADEITWGGDHAAAGALKNIITEPTNQIELKGKDIFEVKNHVSLIIASNSNWAIPAGLNERRFFVLNVSGERAQDHAYFAAIAQQMDSGGREAMLYDLQHRDLSRVNLRVYPRTDGLTDQIIRSLHHAGRFWFNFISNDYMPGEVSTSEFHREYIEWSQAHNERYRLDTGQLGKELRKLCPSIRRRYRGSRTNRRYVYFLPDLEVAMREFEDAVNSPIDWGEPDENNEPYGGREIPPELAALM